MKVLLRSAAADSLLAASRRLLVARAHVGQPLPAGARQERADRMEFDDAAELVVLADEGDLGIDDLDPGSPLHFDKAEFLEQNQGFAERCQRDPEDRAKLVLRNDHAGLKAAFLHGLPEAAVSGGVTVVSQEQPQPGPSDFLRGIARSPGGRT